MFKRLLQRSLDRLFATHHQLRWFGTTPTVKATQLQLFHTWREQFSRGHPPALADTGLRAFSGTDDDGRLLAVFAAIGFGSRRCVDIGAADGVNSNTANLILNFGFTGLMLEGDPERSRLAETFFSRHPDTVNHPPICRHALVDRDNVNSLLAAAGLDGEIDLLSIDIDGNDFWVWQAVTQVEPRVVIIEANVDLGERDWVMAYDPHHRWPGEHASCYGASASALIALGREKGYRLVASNTYGFNLIFVQTALAGELLPEISLETVLAHPRTAARRSLADSLDSRAFVSYPPRD